MPAKKRGKSSPRKSSTAGAPTRKSAGKKKSSGRKPRPLLVETARVGNPAPPPGPAPAAKGPSAATRPAKKRPRPAEEAPDYDEAIEAEDREKFMSVGDHLEELRKRLMTIIVIVIATAAVSGFFVQDIHEFLSQPYRDLTGRSLFLATVYGPLETLIKLAITIGVSLSLPLSFFVLWGFVTPALSRRGGIIGNVSILASSLLFWSGMIFCWFNIFPLSLNFMFTSILPAGTEPQITLEKYYSFFFLVHIGAGLAFQLPLLVIVLGATGLFPLRWHAMAYKYVLMGIAVFAALITDPNPLTQLAMGGVLATLYAISLLILWIIERGRRLRDR